MCFARRSGAGTNYQATRKVLLNEMLKPFAISTSNVIQQPFDNVQKIEQMLKPCCLGLKLLAALLCLFTVFAETLGIFTDVDHRGKKWPQNSILREKRLFGEICTSKKSA